MCSLERPCVGVDALLFHFEEREHMIPTKYLIFKQVTGAKNAVTALILLLGTTDLCEMRENISIMYPFYEVKIELHTFTLYSVSSELHCRILT